MLICTVNNKARIAYLFLYTEQGAQEESMCGIIEGAWLAIHYLCSKATILGLIVSNREDRRGDPTAIALTN